MDNIEVVPPRPRDEHDILCAMILLALRQWQGGRSRDSANGSTPSPPIFRRQIFINRANLENQDDNSSTGSLSSDEIETDYAEVVEECEPDTVDNCFPDQILYRRREPEPGPSSENGLNKFYEKLCPIGYGNTMVPERFIKTMDEFLYPKVTRQLLSCIFTRKTLATHNLTGQPPPAFPNRPAKKQLDPVVVADIVKYVSKRCRVPPSLVRIAITRKCADEARLYKKRQQERRMAKLRRNIENIPPRRR